MSGRGALRFDPLGGAGYNSLATGFTNSSGAGNGCRRERRGRGAVEVGEFLELVFVFITMFLGLGIMVAFGKWWER